MSVQVVDGNVVTAYGVGLDACWNGLCAGRCAIKPLTRFSTDAFPCHCAATLDGPVPRADHSVAWQMISKVLEPNDTRIPDGAPVFLATTTGEIDLLQAEVDAGEATSSKSKLVTLLQKVCNRIGGDHESTVISAACASATVALAQAASMIDRGECDCAVVVACDVVSEFVFSGFASLMALDPQGAHPFDASRKGLTLGEAAGFIVLMSETRAAKEQRTVLGTLAGWGMTNDANHMTGPSRDGGALARAIEAALGRAAISHNSISMVCAHGTGTLYNDSMEMKAFKTVFSHPKPTFSIKGGTGHTMGAAGLLEVLITLKAQTERMVLPTLALIEPAEDAAGWVSALGVSLDNSDWALSTNSGFGGVNAALILRRADR